LETLQEFDHVFQDGIALLRLLRTVVHTFEQRANRFLEVSKLKASYYTFKQGQTESLHNYHKRMVALVEAMKAVGISIVDPCLVEQVAGENERKASEATLADKREAISRAIAMQFVRGADSRYDSYRSELAHAFLNGRDEYPRTLSAAIEVMSKRHDIATRRTTSGEGVAFATTGKGDSDVKPKTKDHITCFKCGEKGHYKSECPAKVRKTSIKVLDGTTMAHTGTDIPSTWVLLDNQSTISLFCNPNQIDRDT
jgi:hypothetical protein